MSVLRRSIQPTGIPTTAKQPMRRSSEELDMRTSIEKWGRSKWPGARIMHELAVGGTRIDIAFILPDHLIGIEIKSSKDNFDRLPYQIKQYMACLPEIWLALAPAWIPEYEKHNVHHTIGILTVDKNSVSESANAKFHWAHPAKRNIIMFAPMLYLAHRAELVAMCADHEITHRTKATCRDLITLLARQLTGDEITSGVCKYLRSRSTKWKCDPPIT